MPKTTEATAKGTTKDIAKLTEDILHIHATTTKATAGGAAARRAAAAAALLKVDCGVGVEALLCRQLRVARVARPDILLDLLLHELSVLRRRPSAYQRLELELDLLERLRVAIAVLVARTHIEFGDVDLEAEGWGVNELVGG